MSRFSQTATANRSAQKCWTVLQDAWVWGSLLGAAEVSNVVNDGDGRLESCEWLAKIGGSELDGTMTVIESNPLELMVVKVQAAEWSGTIDMELTAETQRRTRLHTRARLVAEGFTALLALPIVSRVIGNHLPERMEGLVEIIEE